ncbi:hypothetical protein, partial [Colwellia sp. BRX8-3]|uniref:hypothetical protein n=1 Tax=Colwellia sp. BRX8-3 TaxID=2759837 RepID=UPI0015F51FCA
PIFGDIDFNKTYLIPTPIKVGIDDAMENSVFNNELGNTDNTFANISNIKLKYLKINLPINPPLI